MFKNAKGLHGSTFGTRRNVAIVTVGIIAGAATSSAYALSRHAMSTPQDDIHAATVNIKASTPDTTSITQSPEGSQSQPADTAPETATDSSMNITVNGTPIDVPDAGGSVHQTIPTPGGNVNVQVDTQTSTGSTETFSSGNSSMNVQINSQSSGGSTLNSNSSSNTNVHVFSR